MQGGRTLILGGGVTGVSRRGTGRSDSGERGASCAVATGQGTVLVDRSACRKGVGFVFGAFRVCLTTREWVLIGGEGGCEGGGTGSGACQG